MEDWDLHTSDVSVWVFDGSPHVSRRPIANVTPLGGGVMAESGLITVLFTDLVGSTALSERIGDGAADDLRRRHFELLRSVIARTGGEEVKTAGDAIMVTYRGAADAITGAVQMQQVVERDRAEDDKDRPLSYLTRKGDTSG